MLELLRSNGYGLVVLLFNADRETRLRLNAIAVRESVESRQPHIGHRKMSRRPSVNDVNNGVNGALGMNQHADGMRRHIEETPSFNNLNPVSISVAESTVMGPSIFEVGRVLHRNMEEFIRVRMKNGTIVERFSKNTD